MKYTCEIVIERPRATVVALFDNPDNMKHWQPGLQSFEPLSGTPGQPGARSRLKYLMGKRPIEMIETITERNLPDTFSGTYETKGVWNSVANVFRDEGSRTRWLCESEFKFSGFMWLISKLMPGAFKKETQKMMNQFKAYVEAQPA